MDTVDKDIENRIKLGESKQVTERLDSIPHLITTTSGYSKIVEFGNTGFDIHLDYDHNTFNFTPEDALYPEEEKAPKYASILGVSLLEFHKFLNDPKKISEFELDNIKFTRISAFTNSRLINAIQKLFSRSDVPNLTLASDEKGIILINLQGFKELGEEDPLIEYLHKVSERSKNLTVTYQKIIKRP